MAKIIKESQPVLTHNEKLIAALSYFWVASIVILLWKRNDPYIHFHAKQGFVLWLASILVWIIPPLAWLLNAVVMLFILLGFVFALNGEQWRMPFVARVADKISL